jgi:hypothetical protein
VCGGRTCEGETARGRTLACILGVRDGGFIAPVITIGRGYGEMAFDAILRSWDCESRGERHLTSH